LAYSTAISSTRSAPPQAVGGDPEGAEVEEARERVCAFAFPADERVAADRHVAQLDLAHAAREVDRLRRSEPHAGRPRLDQEERRAARRPRRDEHHVGARNAEHEELPAAQPIPVARAAGTQRDARRVVRVALLQVGERPERLPRDQAGQPRAPLCPRARAQQRRGHQLAAEEGAGRGDATELLQHQAELEDAEPETAPRLRDDEPHPAELGHLRVERAGNPFGRVRRLAHERGRTFAREEFARRALQRLLLLGEPEVDHAPS